jgi:hypothetical protein
VAFNLKIPFLRAEIFGEVGTYVRTLVQSLTSSQKKQVRLNIDAQSIPFLRTDSEGPPNSSVPGETVGQLCRVGDEFPFKWYKWNGDSWEQEFNVELIEQMGDFAVLRSPQDLTSQEKRYAQDNIGVGGIVRPKLGVLYEGLETINKAQRIIYPGTTNEVIFRAKTGGEDSNKITFSVVQSTGDKRGLNVVTQSPPGNPVLSIRVQIGLRRFLYFYTNGCVNSLDELLPPTILLRLVANSNLTSHYSTDGGTSIPPTGEWFELFISDELHGSQIPDFEAEEMWTFKQFKDGTLVYHVNLCFSTNDHYVMDTGFVYPQFDETVPMYHGFPELLVGDNYVDFGANGPSTLSTQFLKPSFDSLWVKDFIDVLYTGGSFINFNSLSPFPLQGGTGVSRMGDFAVDNNKLYARTPEGWTAVPVGGATGSFVSSDSKVITVTDGVITGIV